MVYITPTGEKYHKKTCRMIKGDCTEIGINDAIARGYTACGVCGG
nr:MAG TPA: DNA methyl phosphotriester repair domain protein [Caudoviricetes sp.]